MLLNLTLSYAPNEDNPNFIFPSIIQYLDK